MSKKEKFYLIICVLGILLPYSQYYFFHLENGLDLIKLFELQFENYATRFFAMDLFVTVAAAITFMIITANKNKLNKKYLYLPLASIFLVGLSFGFPLFLFFNEKYSK